MHKEIMSTNTRYKHYFAIESKNIMKILDEYRQNKHIIRKIRKTRKDV